MTRSIDLSDHLNPIVGNEKIPVGNASGDPLHVTIDDITGAVDLSTKADKTTTINGHPLSANVTVTASDVGLGNVDNTSDANKPVSTAQSTAINAKVIDSIADADTTHAPSRNAVFDALAGKIDVGAAASSIDGLSDAISNGTALSVYLGTNAGAASDNDDLSNTAVGYNALKTATGVEDSVAIGYNALYDMVTGDYNTAIGSQSMLHTTGARNTAIGYHTMGTTTYTGSYSIAIGYDAYRGGTSGNRNIVIGSNAGNGSTSGSALITALDCTIIGSYADVSTTNANNQIAIGTEAVAGANNTWIVGKLGTKQCIKEGTNAPMGLATLVGGTATVSTTCVTNNSRIFLSTQVLGTVGVAKAIAVTARNSGSDFTITSADATDTSSIAWEVKEPL